MNKYPVVIAILLTLLIPYQSKADNCDANSRAETSMLMRVLCTLSHQNFNIISESGCCSWHSGVCGCSGGVQQCCDGTLSPSCQCDSDVNTGVVDEVEGESIDKYDNESDSKDEDDNE